MKKYQVTIGFRGVQTQERYISPGTYFENDPKLFGMGAYLVTRNKAKLIGDFEQEESVEEVLADSDIADTVHLETNAHEAAKEKVVKTKAKKVVAGSDDDGK